MFCDGICEKKNKKCGLYTEVTMQRGTEVKPHKACTFIFILESLLRLEQGNVRIQSAIENARNQQADDSNKATQTIANGFLGLLNQIEAQKELQTLNIVKGEQS